MVYNWPDNSHPELSPHPCPVDSISAAHVGDLVWIFSMGWDGNDAVFPIRGSISFQARKECGDIRHHLFSCSTGWVYDGDHSLESIDIEGP